jgi:signal transduction histidine kinase
MMQTARAVLPASVIAEHHRQFTDLHQQHQRLTAGLSPRAWWQFGGPDGPIAQTLEQLGVTCEIREPSSAAGLCTLSTELSIALYRLSCEAVAYLMQHAPSRHVSMEMTARAADGQSIVVDVIVQSTGEALPPLADAYHPFLLSLGASGLSEQALAHRLQLYDGHLQVVQTSPQHMHMLLRVSEPAASFGMACP